MELFNPVELMWAVISRQAALEASGENGDPGPTYLTDLFVIALHVMLVEKRRKVGGREEERKDKVGKEEEERVGRTDKGTIE